MCVMQTHKGRTSGPDLEECVVLFQVEQRCEGPQEVETGLGVLDTGEQA